MAGTLVEFEGLVGGAVPAAGDVASIVGAPLYVAGVHGASGIGITAADYITVTAPSADTWSGAMSIKITGAPASGATRGVIIRDSVAKWLGYVRFHQDGTWQYTNESTLAGTIGTWALNTTYLIEWQVNRTAKTIQWRVTPEGGSASTATSTWTSDSGVLSTATGIGGSGGGAGGTFTADSFRYDTGLSWLGPHVEASIHTIHIENPPTTTTTQGHTFTTPANAQVGDYIFFAWHNDAGNATDAVFPTSIPAGVTLLRPKFTATNVTTMIWWAVHDGRADYPFTGATTSNHARRAVWVRGIESLGTVGGLGIRAASVNNVTAPGIAATAKALGFFGERSTAVPDNVSVSQGTVIAYCPGATSGAAGITSFDLVNLTEYNGADVIGTWSGASSNAFGFLVEYTDGQATSPVTNMAVWDGTAEQPAEPLALRVGGVEAPAQSLSISGYLSVDHMLSHKPFTIAHRGGSKNWPEMTQYAYHQAAWWGCGALELSVARTSDGVFFGLHDENLDRTSGTTGAVPASSMTWAEVQAYDVTAAGTTDPTQPRRPYARLEDILAEFKHTHVIFIDPKYVNSTNYTELFNILLAAMPATRLVGKGYLKGTTWPDQCRARGIKTWGYAYESDVPDLPTWEAKWDLLGMEYIATQAAWDAALAYGKPVIGHITPTANDAAVAMGKGASGLMVSGVQSVVKRRNPLPPPPEPLPDGPPVIVSSSSGYGGTAATASFPKPADVAAGDYLVAAIRHQSSATGPDFDPPVGWERIGPPYITLNSTTRFNAWFGHRVTDLANEPNSYTFSCVSPHVGSRWTGGIIAVRNVSTTDPVATGSPFQPSGNTTAATPIVNVPKDSLALAYFGTETGAANSGAMAGVPAGWTRLVQAAGPVTDGSASATWLNVFGQVFTAPAQSVSAATPFTGPTLSAPACGALVLNGTGTPPTPKVWTETWETWPLGAMAATPPVTLVTGGPTIVSPGIDGKSAESGPGSRKFTVSVAGLTHWSLDFTVTMSGTQTGNNYIASVVDAAGVYVGELNLRLTEKQIWDRIDFGANTLGKSTWVYPGSGPATLRIIYEWKDDSHCNAHLFLGTNLNGTVPDQTLRYDSTMSSNVMVGKRVAAVRFGNDTSTGITQQFDNITLRDLTL
jgi:hypothetical protein